MTNSAPSVRWLKSKDKKYQTRRKIKTTSYTHVWQIMSNHGRRSLINGVRRSRKRFKCSIENVYQWCEIKFCEANYNPNEKNCGNNFLLVIKPSEKDRAQIVCTVFCGVNEQSESIEDSYWFTPKQASFIVWYDMLSQKIFRIRNTCDMQCFEWSICARSRLGNQSENLSYQIEWLIFTNHISA